jgi:hypothetical protein
MRRLKEIKLTLGADVKYDHKVGDGSPMSGRLLDVPARPVEEPHIGFKMKGSSVHPMAVAKRRGFLSRIRIGKKAA